MSKLNSDIFIIRGTRSVLDHTEAVCGPAFMVSYKDEQGNFMTEQVREVYELYSLDTECDCETFSDLDVRGILVKTSCLEKVFDEEQSGIFSLGKYLRTFSLTLTSGSVTLVEYEDRLQLAVTHNKDSEVRSFYLPRVHFGTVKHLLDTCSNEEGMDQILDFAENYKLS